MLSPSEQASLLAVFTQAADRHLGVLPQLGFDAPHDWITTEDEDAGLPGFSATYIAHRRRVLEFNLLFPTDDPTARKRHGLHAHVIASDRPNGPRESLSVDWFTAVHLPEVFDEMTRLADGGGPLEDFIRAVMPIYGALFAGDLKPILSGARWESGTGDSPSARAFGFLHRERGFAAPEGHTDLGEGALVKRLPPRRYDADHRMARGRRCVGALPVRRRRRRPDQPVANDARTGRRICPGASRGAGGRLSRRATRVIWPGGGFCRTIGVLLAARSPTLIPR